MDDAFDRLKLRSLLARLEEYPSRHDFMRLINAEMDALYPNKIPSDGAYDAQRYFVKCVMGEYDAPGHRHRYYCLGDELFARGATPGVIAGYVSRLEPLLSRLDTIDTRALKKAIEQRDGAALQT